jgi:hypothetical protein
VQANDSATLSLVLAPPSPLSDVVYIVLLSLTLVEYSGVSPKCVRGMIRTVVLENTSLRLIEYATGMKSSLIC